MINLWPLLLPVAAWSGFFIATRHGSMGAKRQLSRLSREYVVGLNYLLNEQPDKAVDIFIKLLEVDSDTVDTHLALGSLFRRRGEVDRAIRIHQNIISRPKLTVIERREALLALGQDYLRAGLFDRAEQIFLDVLSLGGRNVASLQGLLTIYEQETAWERALNVATSLERATDQSLHHQMAHYHCELALEALHIKAFDKAKMSIEQALRIDKRAVRASLLKATMDIEEGAYAQAIQILKRVPEQDPEFLTEIIPLLVNCYRALGQMNECVTFLKDTLVLHPRASTVFVIAEHVRQEQGTDMAIDFLSHMLREYPSIKGLNHLIAWHLEDAYGKVHEKLSLLFDVTSRCLDNKPIYRCGQCGFGSPRLDWQCPSCRQWGQIKPIHGLEGD